MEFQLRPKERRDVSLDTIGLQPMEFQLRPKERRDVSLDTIGLQPMEFQLRPKERRDVSLDTIGQSPMVSSRSQSSVRLKLNLHRLKRDGIRTDSSHSLGRGWYS